MSFYPLAKGFTILLHCFSRDSLLDGPRLAKGLTLSGTQLSFLGISLLLGSCRLSRSRRRSGRGRGSPFAIFHDSLRSTKGVPSHIVLASGWEFLSRAAFITFSSTGFLLDLFS